VLLGSLQALLISDFGPGTAMKIVESLRKDILNATLKSGPEIKVALKKIIVRLLTEKVSTTELQLGQR
jgi:fused signal recognition particle receptor